MKGKTNHLSAYENICNIIFKDERADIIDFSRTENILSTWPWPYVPSAVCEFLIVMIEIHIKLYLHT